MKRFLIPLILAIVLIPSISSADTIELKSGRTLKGRVIEKTDTYVKYQIPNGKITITMDEIAKIEDIEDQPDDLISEYAAKEKKKQKLFEMPKALSPQTPAEPGVKVLKSKQANPVSPKVNLTPEQKDRLLKTMKPVFDFLKLETVRSTDADGKEHINVKWPAKPPVETIVKVILVLFVILLLSFFVSALILKYAVKIAGGQARFLEALVFEFKWYCAKMVFVIVLALILVGVQILFATALKDIAPAASIISIVLIFLSPFYLLFLFFRMAGNYFELSGGQVLGVICLGFLGKVLISFLIKLALSSSVVNYMKPYMAAAPAPATA